MARYSFRTARDMWVWGLILFHVCFFRRFYFQNWYINARGEPLEWEFPASRLLGESLRANGFLSAQVDDPYYLSDYTGLPYTASSIPPIGSKHGSAAS